MVKIKGKGFTLNWNGDEVVELVVKQMSKALGEFGLEVESEAKKQLKEGHGVKTGTLRRSIHSAGPNYNWLGDDVEPSKDSPERGGDKVNAVETPEGIKLSVGSGLNYALPVHQGHGSFTGYHYLVNGLNKAAKRLKAIVEKYKV